MAATYELIEAITVGSGGASSIQFSSIPSTYTDLILKVSARSNTSRASNGFLFDIRPNNSSANMLRRSEYGEGSGTPQSSSGSDGYNMALNPSDYTAGVFSSTDIYIPNYAGSAAKSFSTDTVSENNASAALTLMGNMAWSQTSALSSLTLTPLAGSFVENSTAYLYGVKNA